MSCPCQAVSYAAPMAPIMGAFLIEREKANASCYLKEVCMHDNGWSHQVVGS